MAGSWFPRECSLQIFTITEEPDTRWPSHGVCSPVRGWHVTEWALVPGCLGGKIQGFDCAHAARHLLCLRPESPSLLISLLGPGIWKGSWACRAWRQALHGSRSWSSSTPILLPAPQQSKARNAKDSGPSSPEARGHLCPWGRVCRGHAC